MSRLRCWVRGSLGALAVLAVLVAAALTVVSLAFDLAMPVYGDRTRLAESADELCAHMDCRAVHEAMLHRVARVSRRSTEGMFRIALLGDSMGQCGDCFERRAGQPYPVHLERRLNELVGRDHGIDFAIDNYSQGGQQLPHQAALHGALPGRDTYGLVLYSQFNNDLEASVLVRHGPEDYRVYEVLDRAEELDGHAMLGLPGQVLDRLLGWLPAFRWMRWRAALALGQNGLPEFRRPEYLTEQARTRYLDEMALRAFVRRQPLMMLTVPQPTCLDLIQWPNRTVTQCVRNRYTDEALIAKAKARGLGVVDLRDALRELDPSRVTTADDLHLNPWGHQVLGEYAAHALIPLLCELPALKDRLKGAPACTPPDIGALRAQAQQWGLEQQPAPWQ